MTGDVTISNTGVTTIGSNAVTTADIADSQITTSKIVDGTVTNLDLNTGVGGIYKGNGSLSGNTDITMGGSALNFKGGNILVGNGTTLSASQATSNYQTITFPNNTSIRSEDNSGYAGIGLNSNVVRSSISGNAWVYASATSLPAWAMYFGHAASSDYFQIERGAPAIANAAFSGTSLFRINSNGNVGIGTTGPGAKLEVAGQVKITGGTPGLNKVLTSDATGLASWATPSLTGAGLTSGSILVGNASNIATPVAMTGDVTISNTGVTTIGSNAVTTTEITDLTVGTLDLADNAVITAKIADSQITSAKIVDGAVGLSDLADNAVTTVKIADSQITTAKILDGAVANVDLNTGVGGIYKGSGSLNGNTIITASDKTLGIISSVNNGFSVGSDLTKPALSVDGTLNYVGINKINPIYPLDIFTPVSSAIRLQSNGSINKMVHLILNPGDYDGKNTGLRAQDVGGSPTGVTLTIFTQNTDRMIFDPTSIKASESISAISDRRIKENIEDASRYSLESISKIKVRDYNLIKDPLKKTTIGFIAQELYEIFPDAVVPGNDGDPFDGLKNVWAVDYTKLVPLLTKGIQELNVKIENQSKQIDELKSQIEELKTMILNK